MKTNSFTRPFDWLSSSNTHFLFSENHFPLSTFPTHNYTFSAPTNTWRTFSHTFSLLMTTLRPQHWTLRPWGTSFPSGFWCCSYSSCSLSCRYCGCKDWTSSFGLSNGWNGRPIADGHDSSCDYYAWSSTSYYFISVVVSPKRCLSCSTVAWPLSCSIVVGLNCCCYCGSFRCSKCRSSRCSCCKSSLSSSCGSRAWCSVAPWSRGLGCLIVSSGVLCNFLGLACMSCRPFCSRLYSAPTLLWRGVLRSFSLNAVFWVYRPKISSESSWLGVVWVTMSRCDSKVVF